MPRPSALRTSRQTAVVAALLSALVAGACGDHASAPTEPASDGDLAAVASTGLATVRTVISDGVSYSLPSDVSPADVARDAMARPALPRHDDGAAVKAPMFRSISVTDLAGADLLTSHGDVLSGTYVNVGTFHVPAGAVVIVASGMPLSVTANTVEIAGTLDATAAGFAGGLPAAGGSANGLPGSGPGGGAGDGLIEIVAGLDAGEPVVLQGAFTLKSEVAKGEFGGHGH